jgi:hypothetical protein
MKELSIRIVKKIDLDGIHAEIMDGADEGVEAAVQEGVLFIKNDIILEEKFKGHKLYPDVKPATRRQKQKKGNTKILIDTTNLKNSWCGEVNGPEGIIGSGYDGYFDKIYKKWKIDELFIEVHGKETADIMARAVQKKL